MRPLRHSYTNRTLGDGATVIKRYQGPGAIERLAREQAVLHAVRGRVPVPAVLGSADGCLTMRFMAGTHGQELLEAGHGAGVLHACGTMLRRIHRLDVGEIAAAAPAPGQVLVHGDFGPQNVLLDPATMEISAVLDWEWAHAGDPVEDLAWCEWIIRMHHPGQVSLLGAFFGAYGEAVPRWPRRQAFMVGRCQSLLEFCHQHDPGGPGEAQWADRVTVTRGWRE